MSSLKNRIEKLERSIGFFGEIHENPDYKNMSSQELEKRIGRWMFEQTLEDIKNPIDIGNLLRKIESKGNKSGFDEFSDFTSPELEAYRYILIFSIEDANIRDFYLEKELEKISEVANIEEMAKYKKWLSDLEKGYHSTIQK